MLDESQDEERNGELSNKLNMWMSYSAALHGLICYCISCPCTFGPEHGQLFLKKCYQKHGQAYEFILTADVLILLTILSLESSLSSRAWKKIPSNGNAFTGLKLMLLGTKTAAKVPLTSLR